VAIDDGGALDGAGTERLRERQRSERSGWQAVSDRFGPAPAPSTPAAGEPPSSVHEYLLARDVDGRRVLACSRCETVIGDYRANYKLGLLMHEGPLTVVPLVIDPAHFLDEEMVFRRFCCPGCHVQMATELVKAEEPLVTEFSFA
jgi:N-methylhydantoinase B